MARPRPRTMSRTYSAAIAASSRARAASTTGRTSRTVNEHLVPGTEVLVAEMGAYGPGEIAACAVGCSPRSPSSPRSAPPTSSVSAPSTGRSRQRPKSPPAPGRRAQHRRRAARGPFGVSRRRPQGRRGLRGWTRARTSRAGHADGLELRIHGERSGVAVLAPGLPLPIRSNAACAAAVHRARDRSEADVLVKRLGSLPGVPNRLSATGPRRVMSCSMTPSTRIRPAPSRSRRHSLRGPRRPAGLVTPGMVELGKAQVAENAALAGGGRCCDRSRCRRENQQGGAHRGLSPVGTAPPSVMLLSLQERKRSPGRGELGPDRRGAVRERPPRPLPLRAKSRFVIGVAKVDEPCRCDPLGA